MRPAQLRRFADSVIIMQQLQLNCFNEAGAAAPVCQPRKRGMAARNWASMRPAQLRRFAMDLLDRAMKIIGASMRPAQLRRFAIAACARQRPPDHASMRPAQLRRFAGADSDAHERLRVCFNEAGAAAPVCRRSGCAAASASDRASMRPAQLRRFAGARARRSVRPLGASMRPAQLRRFALPVL